MKRLAIVTTHPIQYNAPLFELLSQRKKITLKVFYTWGESVLKEKFDPGFGKIIQWDIPLLKGYDYEFIENIAKDKGSHHFKGIDNPHIIEAIEQFKPDALLVYGWSFKSHLKILRYFKNKIPVFFRGDSTLLDENGFLESIKRNLFLRWIYKHVDVAFYVGKNNFDYFRKAGLKKKQLVLASHAVDNERFECNTTDCKINAALFRQKLQIPQDDFVLLYAGKLEEVKNPAIIPEAFLLAQLNHNVHLVMVGNGVLEKELKDRYAQHPGIHFMDFQNQLLMPSVYEMADVFILSSRSETWGLSVNEAMANGKAIIVSHKCGCAVDLVENEENGYIFDATDVTDLANKMQAIFKSDETLQKMKEESRYKIKLFSLKRLALVIEQKMIELS